MEIDNELLLKSFVTETGEGLVQMEQALLELELHPDDVELVNTVFRVVHTFKGNAAIFDLKFAQEIAHALEDLLDRVRTYDLSFTPDIADVLLASIDVLRELTAAAAAGKASSPSKYKQLVQRVKAQSGTKRRKGKEHEKQNPRERLPQFQLHKKFLGRQRTGAHRRRRRARYEWMSRNSTGCSI